MQDRTKNELELLEKEAYKKLQEEWYKVHSQAVQLGRFGSNYHLESLVQVASEYIDRILNSFFDTKKTMLKDKLFSLPAKYFTDLQDEISRILEEKCGVIRLEIQQRLKTAVAAGRVSIDEKTFCDKVEALLQEKKDIALIKMKLLKDDIEREQLKSQSHWNNATKTIKTKERKTIWEKIRQHPLYIIIGLIGSIGSIISIFFVSCPSNVTKQIISSDKSLSQQETKTILNNSPGAIVNSPGASKTENDWNLREISVHELIVRYPAIDEVIKGLKSCKDLAPEAQIACIKADERIRLTALVLKDPRFTREDIMKIMQQQSLSDMQRIINERLNIIASASISTKADKIYVPANVSAVYIYLQKLGTLKEGSSEFLGRVSRNEFIKKWDEYVTIARNKQMKVVVRASTANEIKWLEREIKYNDKALKKSAFREPSQNTIMEGVELPLK